MQHFIKDLVESRPDSKTILEESPVKSSGSNGVAEKGVRGIEGHIRALYLVLQSKLQMKVDCREMFENPSSTEALNAVLQLSEAWRLAMSDQLREHQRRQTHGSPREQ